MKHPDIMAANASVRYKQLLDTAQRERRLKQVNLKGSSMRDFFITLCKKPSRESS